MAYGLRDFLHAVAQRESGGDARVINRAGFVGKYQFGEACLIDTGYYMSDGSNYRNNWAGRWTGKNGVHSLDQFRSAPNVQDMAAVEWFKLLCKRARNLGLHRYYGATIAGVPITESGVLAGAHLVGLGTRKNPGGVTTFLQTSGRKDPVDGMGTRASEYVRKFGGYDLDCCTGKLNISILDRDGEPIAGAMYELRRGGHTVQVGTTRDDGLIRRPLQGVSFADQFEFWIARMEGDFKKIWAGSVESAEKMIVLRSPKVRITGQTREHAGEPAGHENRTMEARSSGVHIVRNGDRLWNIAKRHKTTVEHLRQVNPAVAKTDTIHPGQRIVLISTTHGHAPEGQRRAQGARGVTRGGVDTLTSTPVRNDQGHPVGKVDRTPAVPVTTGTNDRLIEILMTNVHYGRKDVELVGPVAVKNVLAGRPISQHKKPQSKSLGRCYKYVKIALQASGLVNAYLSSGHAKQAGADLKRQGFRNLLDAQGHGISSPFDAPIGSLIVYDVTDGTPDGHIEVRTPSGFASDYFSDNSRCTVRGKPPTMVGRHRKVTGVWVK